MYAHYLALMFGVGRKPQNSFIPMGPKNSMAGMPTYLTCIVHMCLYAHRFERSQEDIHYSSRKVTLEEHIWHSCL